MRKTTLIFPNTTSLAEFILTYKIKRAEVKTGEKTLTATLSQDELIDACTKYNAEIKPSFFFHSF